MGGDRKVKVSGQDRIRQQDPTCSISKEEHPLSFCSAIRREGEVQDCRNQEETGKREVEAPGAVRGGS